MESWKASLLAVERERSASGEHHALSNSGQALSLRLTEQEHWQQAESVEDGRQPRKDPDGGELEAIENATRFYRVFEVDGEMDGAPAVIAQRLVKRLEHGIWRSEVVVHSYRPSGPPSIAL